MKKYCIIGTDGKIRAIYYSLGEANKFCRYKETIRVIEDKVEAKTGDVYVIWNMPLIDSKSLDDLRRIAAEAAQRAQKTTEEPKMLTARQACERSKKTLEALDIIEKKIASAADAGHYTVTFHRTIAEHCAQALTDLGYCVNVNDDLISISWGHCVGYEF